MADKAPNAKAVPVVVVLIAAGLAWAGSQGGVTIGAVPVFALIVGLVFVVQWIAFVPAFLKQTEHFFDLTGSLTFIGAIVLALVLTGRYDARSLLLTAVVVMWAIRLGTFLFTRVKRTGADDRFDEIKPVAMRFFNVWTIQGLWVSLTLAAALAAVTSTSSVGIDAFAVVGLVVWIAGFAIEAVADRQKTAFRADPANKGSFITSGLWSWSRHPNYFGEILLWVGVALIAFPVLRGWQYLTLISPLFVFALITRVSGVPQLEKKAETKWGGRPDYEAYKARTSSLVPLPPKR